MTRAVGGGRWAGGGRPWADHDAPPIGPSAAAWRRYTVPTAYHPPPTAFRCQSPFAFGDIQFLQSRDDVLGGALGLDLAIDVEDLAVRTDVERPPPGHSEGPMTP